ncbi:MAG TPA: CoA ester lyase [Xanthobacteraceae bacterium]
MIRPRRSMLYMPASNARALEKARTLPVDGIIIDLEDAVAPDAKQAARARVVETLKQGGFGEREVIVRINALDTPWGNDDLVALAHSAFDGILLPKVSDAAILERVGTRLLDLHVGLHVRVWAMMETMFAVLRAPEIAALAKDSETRLAGFVLGTNDLVKESNARIVPGRAPLTPWLMQCVAAARAYGLVILDGVYNGIGDADGFRAECEQGRDMGFDGKTLIHPSQVEPCNAVFSPDPADVAEARQIIAAFDRPENKDKGVLQIDGRMVERMHAEIARRTVAIADAISERGA